MAFVKYEDRGTYINLGLPGDEVTGIVRQVRRGSVTQYGECDFLYLEVADGSSAYMALPAFLKNMDWENLRGRLVKIVYTGKEKSKDGKREFKAYEVFVDDSYTEAVADDDLPF